MVCCPSAVVTAKIRAINPECGSWSCAILVNAGSDSPAPVWVTLHLRLALVFIDQRQWQTKHDIYSAALHSSAVPVQTFLYPSLQSDIDRHVCTQLITGFFKWTDDPVVNYLGLCWGRELKCRPWVELQLRWLHFFDSWYLMENNMLPAHVDITERWMYNRWK